MGKAGSFSHGSSVIEKAGHLKRPASSYLCLLKARAAARPAARTMKDAADRRYVSTS